MCLTHPHAAAQIGSITATGHSLGGALAALCAFDITDNLSRVSTCSAGAANHVAIDGAAVNGDSTRDTFPRPSKAAQDMYRHVAMHCIAHFLCTASNRLLCRAAASCSCIHRKACAVATQA